MLAPIAIFTGFGTIWIRNAMTFNGVHGFFDGRAHVFRNKGHGQIEFRGYNQPVWVVLLDLYARRSSSRKVDGSFLDLRHPRNEPYRCCTPNGKMIRKHRIHCIRESIVTVYFWAQKRFHHGFGSHPSHKDKKG